MPDGNNATQSDQNTSGQQQDPNAPKPSESKSPIVADEKNNPMPSSSPQLNAYVPDGAVVLSPDQISRLNSALGTIDKELNTISSQNAKTNSQSFLDNLRVVDAGVVKSSTEAVDLSIMKIRASLNDAKTSLNTEKAGKPVA